MVKLRAMALRRHSDDFPGSVEIVVRDALGHDHRIIEKIPVVGLSADASFPAGFWIEAESESVDGDSTVATLPYGMETTEGKRSLAVVPADVDQVRYHHDRRWLDGAVHEIPTGVLYGANGATPAQCAAMLAALDEFAGVCARLQLDDHAEFIEGCRWHFDHYPHYLERRRHFRDYATYIRDRHGPLRVPSPTTPEWLRARRPGTT